MDLRDARAFRELDVALVSISPDDIASWKQVAGEFGIPASSLVSDPGNRVANRYGVMRWRVPAGADLDSAEPGHTFVLVAANGRIRWIRDYGAPQNGGLMYVPPEDLVPDMRVALQG